MSGFGATELIVVFLVILLFFGGTKIPEIARGLGKGIREFRKARDEVADSLAEKPALPTEKSPEHIEKGKELPSHKG